jgi:hypothetical protein
VKPEWIRGAFRGVYSGHRTRSDDGARRVPLEIEYGELSEVAFAAGPEPEDVDEIRFERLRKIQIPASSDGPVEGERALFDVRIRDWRLLHPAESRERLYGTLVGTLCARLLPEPEEPEPLAPVPAPAPESRPEPEADAAPEPATVEPPAAHAAARDLRATWDAAPAPPESDAANPDLERLLWLAIPLLLLGVGAVLGVFRGPELAAIWLVPLVVALAIRQTPVRYRIHAQLARRWVGGLCVLAPIFALLSPLRGAWFGACAAPLRLELVLLGVPIAAAALVGTQIWLWLCAVLWTAIVAGWCAGA